MAKASKSTSKSGSSKTTTRKSAGKSTARKSTGTKSSASKAAASKATEVSTPTDTVTPSALKKDIAAENKPMPEVAKEPAPETLAEPVEVAKEVETPEPVVETPRDTVPDVAPPVAPTPERRSVFMPLVLGGLIAGGIGFAVSEFNVFNTRINTDALRNDIAAQETRLEALESAEPPAAPEVDLTAIDDLSAKVDDLSAQLTEVSGQVADIDARLVVVEKRPIAEGEGSSAAAVAAYERELATLQTTVEEMIANARSVEAATADAAAATRELEQAARVREALAEITTAVAAGQPFEAAVATLSDAGIADVPAALSDVAADGVVTLSNLQDRFPDAARTALSAARSSGEVEEETGVGGFLRRQLGARSVAPREGDSPDAVLSRAEAAVRDGQLAAALGELDTLSEGTQANIQDWLDDARARAAAEAAVKDISQSLTAN